MARGIPVSAALSSVVSVLTRAVAHTLAFRASLAAQKCRIRAELLVAVGPRGTDRARLSVGPGASASVAVFSADGRVRTLMGTGGPATHGGVEPETADFVLFAQDGTPIARLGTRRTADSHAAGVILILLDSQGRVRLNLQVAEDGTPAIQMLDANGNVTWSALTGYKAEATTRGEGDVGFASGVGTAGVPGEQ